MIKYIGLATITASLLAALISTIILGVSTSGCGPTTNPEFYQTYILAISAPTGSGLTAGVILTLVGCVAKHVHLKKKVDRNQVKDIVKEVVQNMDETIKNGDKLVNQLAAKQQKLKKAQKSLTQQEES